MKLRLVTSSLFFAPLLSNALFQVFPFVGHSPATVRAISTTLYQSSSSEDSSSSFISRRISIEYCTGCRWMLKSFWLAQELLTTFDEDLDAVTVLPSSSKGVFAVKFNGHDLLWDRKEQGGFPSPKGLKQIVRDMVEPDKFLGHSDSENRQKQQHEQEKPILLEGAAHHHDDVAVPPTRSDIETNTLSLGENEAPLPSVTITYCTGCRWLLRAAYFGQELLTTFGEEIKSVTLVPSKPPAKGGQFSIALNGKVLFDRATEGRFPEVKEIKQMIRDTLVPDKDLGHSDVVQHVQDNNSIIKEQTQMDDDDDDDDDEDAEEEARKFFGVA